MRHQRSTSWQQSRDDGILFPSRLLSLMDEVSRQYLISSTFCAVRMIDYVTKSRCWMLYCHWVQRINMLFMLCLPSVADGKRIQIIIKEKLVYSKWWCTILINSYCINDNISVVINCRISWLLCFSQLVYLLMPVHNSFLLTSNGCTSNWQVYLKLLGSW